MVKGDSSWYCDGGNSALITGMMKRSVWRQYCQSAALLGVSLGHLYYQSSMMTNVRLAVYGNGG